MSRQAELRSVIISLRLTRTEKAKLDALCRYTRREQGDLLRLLIHMATPTDGTVLPLEFPTDLEKKTAWE